MSTFTRQLSLNVHSANGALLVSNQPLIYTYLVEKVHTWKAPDIFTFLQYRQTDGALFLCVFFCSFLPILFAVQFPLFVFMWICASFYSSLCCSTINIA